VKEKTNLINMMDFWKVSIQFCYQQSKFLYRVSTSEQWQICFSYTRNYIT